MADSFTSLLRFRQQQTGANNNTWGALLNAAVFQLCEDSIAGRVTKVVAGVDITLSTNNGSSDEARMSTIALTGSPGATRNIIIPNLTKWYIVENLTNAAQRIKTAAMADVDGYLVSVNDRKIVLCDGNDGVFGVADTLGGLDASAFARRAERNSFSAGNADVPREFTDGATITFDTEDANVWFGTLAGDRTVAITNQVDGSWLDLYFSQDATGGRDISSWPANIVWENGTEPEFPGSPNTTDLVQLRYIDDLSIWFGRHTATLNAPGGGTLISVEFVANDYNVDVYAKSGSPSGPVTLTLRIPEGILISSLSPATAALMFQGFAATSIINIINEGTIHGCGGKGGRGGAAGDGGSANLFFAATAGTDGGDAILGPSTACTINITNADGRIWGGGGGGGGGGCAHDGDGSNVATTGGGGGGGAGGGQPGDPGSFCGADGTPGEHGGIGRSGDFGAFGTGQDTGGTGDPGDGGNGGTWGADGDPGESVGGFTLVAPPGTGGTAGKAFETNGGSMPAFVSGNTSPNVEGAVS